MKKCGKIIFKRNSFIGDNKKMTDSSVFRNNQGTFFSITMKNEDISIVNEYNVVDKIDISE